MAKRTKGNTEIVAIRHDIKAMIQQAVKERVNAIVAEMAPPEDSSAKLFPPADSMDMFERRWTSLYFERWGCTICGRNKKIAHASNGMCTTCRTRIGARKAQLKLEYEEAHPEIEITRQIERLTLRSRSAQALLEKL